MLLQQMDDKVDTQREWMQGYKFHLVTSVDRLKKLVDLCLQRKTCSLDLETTGLDNRVYQDEFFGDGKKTRHGMRTVDKVAGLCISFDGYNGYYVPVGHYPEDSGNLPWDEAWEEITRLVNGCRVVFHGAKFDCEFLYPVTGKDHWKLAEYEDTYLMSKVISPLKQMPNGLKQLSKIHFNVEMLELSDLFTPEKMEQMKRDKQGYNFAVLHPKEGLAYGCSDGIFTYKLREVLHPKLSDSDQRIYDLEKSFCNVIRELERNRVHVDVDRVEHLRTECTSEMHKVGDSIREVIEGKTGKTGRWITLNIGAVQQLSEALITDSEGLRLKPTAEMLAAENEGQEGGGGGGDSEEEEDGSVDDKQYSLKDEALKSLHKVYGAKFSVVREGITDKDGSLKRESIFELILEWRHYQKMLGSYLNPLSKAVDKYGDVRPNFSQIGTDTTRLSSKAGKIADGYSGINFQGIPRDSDEDKPDLFKQLRTCIIPRKGWMLVKLDYAGEELRVVTNLSGDPIWTKSFLYEDGDVHSITARTLFGKKDINKDERNRGKRCNFAFIYGGGAGAIQRNVGCSIEEASKHMENLRNDVPILMGYVEFQKKYAHKHKCIYTAFGRRIPIPTIDSPIRGIRSKAERCAINYTIQATSADVLKFTMCYVDKQLRTLGWKDRCRYVLTVHDEVVYEIKPEFLMEIVRKLDEWMTEPWRLQKAHGRAWDVPLLTEPGVDCNWKARFDYFAMVDGAPVNPKDTAEDGTFKGKLKKDQYFADGRIYQKVPEFLEQWIRRVPVTSEPKPERSEEVVPTEPAKDVVVETMVDRVHTTGSGADPVEIVGRPVDMNAEERTDTPESARVEAEKPAAPKEEEPPPPPPRTAGVNDFSMDDFDVPLPVSKEANGTSEPAIPAPAPVEIDLSDSMDPGFGSSEPKSSVQARPEKREVPSGDREVVRWVLRSPMTKRNQKKLHAVCVLTEGVDILRVVDSKGNVIISEESGILVDSRSFPVIAGLFGLG